ncbi:MAG TPA: esterase [Planctomycetaceae bacterium]|nr:esterase [Planctomycetaceae bacterium]HRF00204.1 alpha/beta hydrolase-fold protein [Pirellulaceae bacterium]
MIVATPSSASRVRAWGFVAIVLSLLPVGSAVAQPRGPVVVSPEIADRSVTFRVLAPKADEVTLFSSDLPRELLTGEFAKDDEGVWSLTIENVPGGAYRYLFEIDGVRTVDPRHTETSESNGNLWSLVRVPGAAFMDRADVPHGSVTRVNYRSRVLDRDRRLHVYTPPGYESSSEKYPVFYLLHGAGDSDDAWTSVGRAHDILDNLIAAQKIVPMIVVMPNGHTGPFSWIQPVARDERSGNVGNASFEQEFVEEIRPMIETRYRVIDAPNRRAIAGLSMGGAQTLEILTRQPKDFAHVGVFSSGLIFGDPTVWEAKNQAMLDDAEVRAGIRLLWFGIGKEDFLLRQAKATVELLERHEFEPTYVETDGGHTWSNWQRYLEQFAPQLFRD